MTTWYAFSSGLRKSASEDWTHGTPNDFDEFDMEGDPYSEKDPDKHWNTHLGPHFTSVHETAEQFAHDKGGDEGGYVHHVKLDLKSPKHYESEHDMDREAWEHASKHLHVQDWEGEKPSEAYNERIINSHEVGDEENPGGPIVADEFKKHLIRQGHDGVTYGNEHEAPRGHKCAIAFHPEQIQITHTHHVDEPCTKVEEEYWSQQKAKDYGKASSLDLTSFFKAANAPNYNEKGRLDHYRFQGHEPAEGEHAIFRGIFLGHETGEKDRPTEPADVLKHIEDHQRKHLERHGVDPEHERMNNYGSHWTTDPSTAHQFSLDPQHGKWRSPRRSEKYPSVGAVLEVHTTEEPSTQFSQYGERELDSLPKRSQITKAWLHVHRHDPTLEATHHNEDFKQPDSWTPEFAEKINKPNPVPYYKQNTLLSTTPIQVPKGKRQASLDLTAFFREAASGPLIFYPAKHGGKYHLTDAISETARCRATVEVDRSGETIHVQPDQERIHPIICKRCLDSGRAAQGKGKHVSGSKASDYRFEHEQHFTGDHRIDAWHKSGEHAGFAEFAADGGLDEIEVNPEHQRKGVATGIWEHAKSVGINPQHSNVRSSDGDEWAHSTGDPVPENEWKYPNSFSTAFTAPGYHHPYTSADFPKALGLQPKSPRQAALHDISKPKYVDSYYMSDEEKEKAREQSQKDYDDFHAKIKEEAGLPADTDNYQVKKHWDRGMKSALTKGDISIDDAEQRGYHGDAREHGENLRKWDEEAGHPVESRHGGWQNLASHSDKFYHVSTNADAAAKEGLKTRHELNQGKGGAGLGGGSDDTVSVTSDRSLAPDIYHSLHEHHAVVTGKIKPEQLHEYAKNPPHGQPFDHMLVHKGEDGKMSADEQEFDQVKRGVINNGYSAGGPSWGTFKSQDEVDKAHPGEGWKPAPEGLVTGPEHPRHPLYNRWERPATEDEKVYQRSQFYKKFSAYRHSTGKGHRDPLFMSNDPVAFSKADPSRFGILHLKPHPKAQGYPLHAGAEHHPGADSGEWRLGSGSPFDVTHVERPTPRHLEEFGDDHKTASKDDVWYHGTDAETATKVRQQGDFSGYENKAKGSRVWGKGVYMAKDPSETARFGEHQVAVSHGMKNPFVLTHEHGFPGPFTVVRHLSPESQDVFDEQHASFSATARPGSGGNSAGEALRMALQHEGHDGVIFPGDNDTDWAVNYRPENVKVHRQDKTSAVRDVRDADSDAGAQTGIMVAIAPPASVVKNIAVEEGEAPKQIHLTLAYLGDTADYADDVVANLPEVIEAWAEGTQKFQATTQGAGTFVKSEEDGQHVLWAAVDAPGLHRIHTDLVDYLREHDFKPREDHSFTPHMTLAYGKHHFRFIPKIERQTWTVDEVWCCIGGIWQSFPLSG